MTENETRELQRLRLSEHARNAVCIYCDALDTGTLDQLSEILDDNVVLEISLGGEVCGREAVVNWFADAISEQVNFRKHFNTNAQINHLSDEEAEINTYFFSLLGRGDDLVVAWGRFIFDVRAIDTRVWITRIRLEIEMPPSSVQQFLK